MSSSAPCRACGLPVAVLDPSGVCPSCAGQTRPAVRPLSATDPDGTTPGGGPPPSADPAPPPGYDLAGQIGAGGMGVVYRATERATGRAVAVKYVLAPAHPTAHARFRREVRALAKVRHPNVVSVFAVMLDGRDPYFTMEYVPGGPLGRKLAVGGPLPPAAAAGLVAAAARGVAAAHAAGVLHRDIKPANILLDLDGTPKVADFGLAKSAGRDDGLTGTDSAVGTPNYMPPEQAVGGKDVDERADVYGLGAVLYECLTGRRPFDAATPLETVRMVLAEPPAPPRRHRPDLPADLEAVCLRCLEKSPAKRYPTAAALADDLERFARGEATAARPATPGAKAWRAARRRWRWAAAAGLLLAAVGAGAAIRPRTPAASAAAPADPREEIVRELKAGRPVTLIGPTGLPKWYANRLAPTTLGPAANGDGSCEFQSIGTCLVELLPDPGVDSYTLRAEVRHVGSTLPVAAGSQRPLGTVGLYVTGVTRPRPDGLEYRALVGVTFNDAVPVPPPGRPADPTQVHCQAGLLTPVIDREDTPLKVGQFWEAGRSHSFAPSDLRPWRVIEIEVTLAGVAARWGDRPGQPLAPLAAGTWADTRAQFAALQPRLDLLFPGAGLTVPEWTPRAAVGIWCYASAVAVRNVVLDPR